MNAAVWFGAAVFFVAGVGPVTHSLEMQELLGPRNYPYFGGAIGQLLAARCFHLHLACAAVALLHLCAEWIYLGRSPRRRWLGLLFGLVAFVLFQSLWLQPRLKQWHAERHALNASSEQRERAGRSFTLWHATSQTLNFLALGGLAVYLWRVAHPPDTMRVVSAATFPGAFKK